MTTDEIYAVWAERFHEAYERLAPDFGYRTREASAKPWAEVPEQNRALMTAVCAEIVPLLIAQGRAERGYARDGEEVCGDPYPGGGKPCQLRRGHDAHARPASAGFSGWTTDLEASLAEARAQGRREAAEAIRAEVEVGRDGYERAELTALRIAARIAEGGTP